jgi:hypothetical protein
MTEPASLSAATARGTTLALVALEAMPCGCISSVFRANPTVVEVEVVEAKGPHCSLTRHRPGDVVRLGVPNVVFAEGDEPQV